MADWQSHEHLEDHFRNHGPEVGARTIAEYDASARSLLARDDVLVFGYVDEKTGLNRLGLYDTETRHFTGISDDERWIVTHFRAAWGYIRDLMGSD